MSHHDYDEEDMPQKYRRKKSAREIARDQDEERRKLDAVAELYQQHRRGERA
jgi:hypothetical protein